MARSGTAPSLRKRLLAWVMLPLLGAVAVDGWISHHEASATASVVQDRLLLGSARIVAEQLHLEDGAFQDHGAQRVFIQNAAHQLRTPLTLLSTQVSYAVRATDASGRSESLAAIQGTVQQSARLVNQLLTLSAVEAQEHAGSAGRAEKRVQFDAPIRQVLEDLAGQAQAKGIDLGFEMTGAGALIAAPRLALREIAMNLVDNAIRYTPPGGIVTTHIDVTADAMTLLVEDNGPGIAPEERERVFERFYRIHDGDSAGSGLGLPIVREFASRIGASVELRTSAAGQGLTVAVRFAHRAADPGA